MSYDCTLVDPVTKEPLHSDSTHFITGGTYAVGGTTELWVNITFNYAQHFCKAFGTKEHIKGFDGKLAVDTIPLLQTAISKLGDDVSTDYWEATEGNAKKALYKLLALAKMRPDGMWEIDY